jgi:hypothetical protein
MCRLATVPGVTEFLVHVVAYEAVGRLRNKDNPVLPYKCTGMHVRPAPGGPVKCPT